MPWYVASLILHSIDGDAVVAMLPDWPRSFWKDQHITRKCMAWMQIAPFVIFPLLDQLADVLRKTACPLGDGMLKKSLLVIST